MIVSQLILNIIISATLYLLLALSFSLIYYATKIFHLAHGAIITLGPYLVYYFVFYHKIPTLASIIAAVTCAAILGSLIDIVLYRRMRNNNKSPMAYLLASLGLYIIIQNIISLCFGDDAKAINTSMASTGFQIGGGYISSTQIIIIMVSFIMYGGVNIILHYTKLGKSIRAISSNPELSCIYGLSARWIIVFVFGLGSFLAALGGILNALESNMTPTYGFNLLLYAIIVMIVGGVGSNKGMIAGAFLIAMTQSMAAYCIDPKWMDALTYIILILFLMWRPLGFSGNLIKKIEI